MLIVEIIFRTVIILGARAMSPERDQVRGSRNWLIAGIARGGVQAKILVRALAVLLVVISSSPCVALSEGIRSFNPATPEEVARWTQLLGLRPDARLPIKSIKLQLRDAAMSITRVENAACDQDVCPTFFKYELGRVFEFVIPCKEGLGILDVPMRDINGQVVHSIVLDVGHGLSTLVRPTSLGPIITPSRHAF
jgi:hypothetical protein